MWCLFTIDILRRRSGVNSELTIEERDYILAFYTIHRLLCWLSLDQYNVCALILVLSLLFHILHLFIFCFVHTAHTSPCLFCSLYYVHNRCSVFQKGYVSEDI